MFSNVRSLQWDQWRLIATAALLVPTLGVSSAISAQQAQVPQIFDFTIGCREEPSSQLPISIAVADAWVEENALFADIAVTNRSSAEIDLPARNPGGRYWDAVLYDGKGESITYCGGVSEVNLDPFAELVGSADIVKIRPGETVTLSRLYLAPFWPYLREPEYDTRSFEAFYIGWSNVVVHVDAAQLDKLGRALEQASKRQCSLYGGELRSRKRNIPAG